MNAYLYTLTGNAVGYSGQCKKTDVDELLPYIEEVDVGVVHVPPMLESTPLLPDVSLIPKMAQSPTKLSSRLVVWPINRQTETSLSFSARAPFRWTSGCKIGEFYQENA